MCGYCFDVLHREIAKGAPEPQPPAFADDAYPLFVTWKKWSKSHGEYILRGCIGNFSAQRLHAGLAEYAITSALHDRRFEPIAAAELPSLSCAVSLLTNFEKAKDYLDWEVGTHGIWIEYELENGKTTTATYLPEVMPEQNWSKVEAIDSLLRKGGYRATPTEAVRRSIRLTRYQSEKGAMTYAEWAALRGLTSS